MPDNDSFNADFLSSEGLAASVENPMYPSVRAKAQLNALAASSATPERHIADYNAAALDGTSPGLKALDDNASLYDVQEAVASNKYLSELYASSPTTAKLLYPNGGQANVDFARKIYAARHGNARPDPTTYNDTLHGRQALFSAHAPLPEFFSREAALAAPDAQERLQRFRDILSTKKYDNGYWLSTTKERTTLRFDEAMEEAGIGVNEPLAAEAYRLASFHFAREATVIQMLNEMSPKWREMGDGYLGAMLETISERTGMDTSGLVYDNLRESSAITPQEMLNLFRLGTFIKNAWEEFALPFTKWWTEPFLQGGALGLSEEGFSPSRSGLLSDYTRWAAGYYENLQPLMQQVNEQRGETGTAWFINNAAESMRYMGEHYLINALTGGATGSGSFAWRLSDAGLKGVPFRQWLSNLATREGLEAVAKSAASAGGNAFIQALFQSPRLVLEAAERTEAKNRDFRLLSQDGSEILQVPRERDADFQTELIRGGIGAVVDNWTEFFSEGLFDVDLLGSTKFKNFMRARFGAQGGDRAISFLRGWSARTAMGNFLYEWAEELVAPPIQRAITLAGRATGNEAMDLGQEEWLMGWKDSLVTLGSIVFQQAFMGGVGIAAGAAHDAITPKRRMVYSLYGDMQEVAEAARKTGLANPNAQPEMIAQGIAETGWNPGEGDMPIEAAQDALERHPEEAGKMGITAEALAEARKEGRRSVKIDLTMATALLVGPNADAANDILSKSGVGGVAFVGNSGMEQAQVYQKFKELQDSSDARQEAMARVRKWVDDAYRDRPGMKSSAFNTGNLLASLVDLFMRSTNESVDDVLDSIRLKLEDDPDSIMTPDSFFDFFPADVREAAGLDLSAEQNRKVVTALAGLMGVGEVRFATADDLAQAVRNGKLSGDDTTIRGWYVQKDEKTGKDVIYINPTSAVRFTFGHEVMHRIQATSPAIAAQLHDVLANGGNLSPMLERYRAQMAKDYSVLGNDYAQGSEKLEEEFTADMLGMMMQDIRFVQDVAAEIERREAGAGAQFIQMFLDTIRAALAEMARISAPTALQRRIIDDYARKEKQVASLLADFSERYREAQPGEVASGEARLSIAQRLNEERAAIEAKGGVLALVHHGTTRGTFTSFGKTYSGAGYFFVTNRDVAAGYASMQQNKPVALMSRDEIVSALGRVGALGYARFDGDGFAISDAFKDREELVDSLGLDAEEDAAGVSEALIVKSMGRVVAIRRFDRNAAMQELKDAYVDVMHGARGVYDVAVRMDRPLVIDAKGAKWNEIRFRRRMMSTDAIALDAWKQGYDGVVIHNVQDNTPASYGVVSDVYIVNPDYANNIKAVQEMTYDDNGEIIPAEQRLDWNSRDIRHSISRPSTALQLPAGNSLANTQAAIVEILSTATDADVAARLAEWAYARAHAVMEAGLDKSGDLAASMEMLDEWLEKRLPNPHAPGTAAYEDYKRGVFGKVFQRYLFDGKVARIADPYMRDTFRQLKQLVRSAYRSVELIVPQLPLEASMVFDQMLAAEDVVEGQTELHAFLRLMRDQAEKGLNAENGSANALAKLFAKARAEMVEKQEKALAKIADRLLPGWREAAEKIADGIPAYAALKEIAAKGGLDMQVIRPLLEDALSREDAEGTRFFGKEGEIAGRIAGELGRRGAEAQSGQPSAGLAELMDIAQRHGWRGDVAAMLQDVARGKTRAEFVEGQIEGMHKAWLDSGEYGLDEEAMANEAMIQALEQLELNLSPNRGRSDAVRSRWWLANWAVQELGRKTVGQILKDDMVKSAQGNLNEMVEELGKKTPDDARLAGLVGKTRQNLAILKELAKARRTAEKAIAKTRRALKSKGGAIDGEYKDAIGELAFDWGFTQTKPRNPGTLARILTAAREEAKAELGAEMDGWSPLMVDTFDTGRGDYTEMSLQDFNVLAGVLDYLEYAGRQRTKGEKADYMAYVHSLVDGLLEDMPASGFRHTAYADEKKSAFRGYFASISNLNKLMGQIGPHGSQVLLDLAGTAESDVLYLQENATRRLDAALGKFLKDFNETQAGAAYRDASGSPCDLAQYLNSILPMNLRQDADWRGYRDWTGGRGKVNERTAGMMLMLALYLGSASGRQRVMSGYGWGAQPYTDEAGKEVSPDYDQLDAAFQPFFALFTDGQLEAVNEIWAVIGGGELTSSVAEAHRRATHTTLAFVPPAPFIVDRSASGRQGVAMDGGYVPLHYLFSDRGPGSGVDAPAENNAARVQNHLTPSSVLRRLSEVRDAAPVTLDVNVLYRHIADNAHYATHRVPMGAMLHVVADRRFKEAYVRTFGQEQYEALADAVRRVANPKAKAGATSGTIMNTLRTLFFAKAFFGNVKSAMKTTTSATVGVDELGRFWGEAWLAPGESRRFALENSALVRNRLQYWDPHMSELMAMHGRSGWAKAQGAMMKASTILMRLGDGMVVSVNWTAAYNKAVSEGKSHHDAVVYADTFIGRTQGSSREIDKTEFQSQPYSWLLAPFMGITSAMYNETALDWQTKKGGDRLAATLANLVFPGAMSAVIAMVFAPPKGRDEEDRLIGTAAWRSAVRAMLLNPFSGMPYVRELADFVADQAAGGTSRDPFNIGAVSYLQDIAKDIGSARKAYGRGDGDYGTYLMAKAVSDAFGIPFITAYQRLVKSLENMGVEGAEALDAKERLKD